MILKEVKSNRLGDKYFCVEHASGLRVFVYPKRGHSSTYAIIGTKYGSINTSFKPCGENDVMQVPDGIAHYLEHKLFESEDGDAFSKYAKTGASANAYTSFDMTCYLFSCTEKFEKSLKILLELVQSPYFTPENVEKERGIIGQEIRMYDDDPSWRVMFNLLGAMYHKHPVKVDIAGTVESIAKITPENLYKCYKNFYNPSNMVLCVAGNVDPERVFELVDELIKPNDGKVPECIFPEEPYNVVTDRVEQHFEIAMPTFQLGFKEKAGKDPLTEEQLVQTDIILQALASKSSRLYKRLLDESLINDSFGYEYFEGRGYAAVIFSGESKVPDKTAKIIKEAIDELHKNGVDKDDFERAKKLVYGRNVAMLNSAENIANEMMKLSFAGRELFHAVECIANTTLDQVNDRLKHQLDNKNSSLSVVLPMPGKKGK